MAFITDAYNLKNMSEKKYNPFSLEGKTILITGASSGIGRTTAIECSKMGAKVVIVGRNKERLYQTYTQLEGTGHQQITAELTDSLQLDNLIQNLVNNIDGLVLCAGIGGNTRPLQFCPPDKFKDVFDVNTISNNELLRLIVKKKKIARGGSVVFVSSIGGVKVFNPGNAVYGASKAALNALMKFNAIELAPKHIRVNSVNPGMVNTNLIQRGIISEEQHKLDMDKYPLKRYGEPIDIAMGIIYLLSDASSWVTGHSLVIDGGYTI